MRLPVTALLALMLATTAHADEWRANTESSLVGFGAVQQRAKFNGRFYRFEALIRFDENEPANTHIGATIELGSVDTQYADRDNMLAEEEWFSTRLWPTAEYRADSATVTDAGLVANGVLTLRNISLPVPLAFSITRDGNSARLIGSAELSRLAFGVGQGDWTDTQWVGDTVTIKIELDLVPASDSRAGSSTNPSAE